jgi:hypothetical protein
MDEKDDLYWEIDQDRQNIRYDDVVHACDFVLPGSDNPHAPLCGVAMIPVERPELTNAAINCWQCDAIIN